MEEARVAIEVKNLNHSFNGMSVLEDVNLTVKEYDFLGLIGPNGGGKTTLLRVILGLIKVDAGTVLIFGRPLEKMRQELAYVPQFSFFDRDFPINVWDTVIMGRLGVRKGRFYSKEDKVITEEMLELVEMFDLRERQMGSLSGGERQRVLLARALVSKPRLLLLDEPTASIDSKFQANFYEIIKDLNKKMTILMVSHDISAISAYVNKIACMNHRLYFEDSKEISEAMLENTYHCPIDLIAHGVPHRVLKAHNGVVEF